MERGHSIHKSSSFNTKKFCYELPLVPGMRHARSAVNVMAGYACKKEDEEAREGVRSNHNVPKSPGSGNMNTGAASPSSKSDARKPDKANEGMSWLLHRMSCII